VKAGWQPKKLRDVCELINGRAYSKPELLAEGKYPVLRVGNFFTNNNWYYSDMELGPEKYCDKGDLLYAWSASFGPRIWTGDKVIFHYHIWKVQPFPMIEKRFLFMWLLWDIAQIKADQGTGTTMIHVAKGSMEDRDLLVPPLPEQRRIASILDEAFEGIATARANAEKNLQNARALFESHLQSVFTQRGDGWQEKRFGDLATFRNGINFTKASRGDSIKIVGVRDFQKNYWAPLDRLESVVTDGALPDSDLLQENDVLFVRSNGNPELIGRCLLVGTLSEKTTHSGFTIRARLNGGGVTPKYLCHFLRSNKARREMIDSGTGINIKSLNQTTLSGLVIPAPSLSDQARVVRQLEGLSVETQRLASIYQQKLAALDELKKSLLHQAFSGEL